MTDIAPNIDVILAQVEAGDPVGAAYKLAQALGQGAPGRAFYEAGSIALARRDELGEEALRFARLAFAEAVERDPQLGEAHHDLATTMRELGMPADAATQYRRALELMPGDEDCLIGLGAALCDAGQLDEGIATLEQAATTHPESGGAYANLGLALEAAGRDEAAASAYAKAVQRFDAALLDTNDEEAAHDLMAKRRWARIQHAELLERLERWPQAIVEYRRLHEEEQAMADPDEEEESEDGEDSEETEDAAEAEATGDTAAPARDEPAPRLVAAKVDDDDITTGEHELHLHDHESDPQEGDEEGREGLERVFSRLVGKGRLDLAYLVLDELGGELADSRTRANYAIYDAGDGLPAIMVEHWDSGKRERLEPGAM